jgi:hypothetical protein
MNASVDSRLLHSSVRLSQCCVVQKKHVFTFHRCEGRRYINRRYIKKRAYSNATLCQNFKAIGEELSEI